MNPVRDTKFYYIYVLQSQKSGLFYTGYTSNLQKRLNEHDSGKSQWTKNRGPFHIIYSEACLDINDAKAREKYLKSGMGKRYIKNRLKKYLSSTNI